jgi:hypothetical protein
VATDQSFDTRAALGEVPRDVAGPASDVDDEPAPAELGKRVEESAVHRLAGELVDQVLAVRTRNRCVAATESICTWIAHAATVAASSGVRVRP